MLSVCYMHFMLTRVDASQEYSNGEQNYTYAQIEKVLLAIAFALWKFGNAPAKLQFQKYGITYCKHTRQRHEIALQGSAK